MTDDLSRFFVNVFGELLSQFRFTCGEDVCEEEDVKLQVYLFRMIRGRERRVDDLHLAIRSPSVLPLKNSTRVTSSFFFSYTTFLLTCSHGCDCSLLTNKALTNSSFKGKTFSFFQLPFLFHAFILKKDSFPPSLKHAIKRT